MRIAHVLRRLSFDDWGGTEQVVWNLAKAQKAAGHDVRLFATTALWKDFNTKNTKGTKGFLGALRSLRSLCSLCWENKQFIETVDGIEIYRFRPVYPWWPMPKSLVAELDRKGGNPFVPGLGRALREWRPDVIHCHAMARIAELCLRVAHSTTQPPAIAKATAGKPNHQTTEPKTVISLHGGGANVPTAEAKSLKAPTRGRLPWGKLVDYAMGWVRRIPEDADGIVCVGEDEYERYRAKHPHVMYLPNGVDTSLFGGQVATADKSNHPTTQPSAFAKATADNPNHLTILCVARIDRQKNQLALVEHLARHPGRKLRLVGPVTQPDYREELERRAAELGVVDRVAFVGALKPGSPELLAEYRNADIFVLPSRHEPFGIVVLEAWAAGLPVAASDVGGLGRLCAAHPRAAAVFAPGDAAALDAAVDKAFAERAEMSAAGVAAAHEYDWAVLAARLVDFYADIC